MVYDKLVEDCSAEAQDFDVISEQEEDDSDLVVVSSMSISESEFNIEEFASIDHQNYLSNSPERDDCSEGYSLATPVEEILDTSLSLNPFEELNRTVIEEVITSSISDCKNSENFLWASDEFDGRNRFEVTPSSTVTSVHDNVKLISSSVVDPCYIVNGSGGNSISKGIESSLLKHTLPHSSTSVHKDKANMVNFLNSVNTSIITGLISGPKFKGERTNNI